jgi:hypothetical protein
LSFQNDQLDQFYRLGKVHRQHGTCEEIQ